MAAEDIRFRFSSGEGSDLQTPAVYSINGSEGISKPFCFEILLVVKAGDAEINFDNILKMDATLSIRTSNDENKTFYYYRGIISEFEQQKIEGNLSWYRAILVPKVTQSFNRVNKVFLGYDGTQTTSKVIKKVLDETDPKPSYSIHEELGKKDTRKRDFIYQYQETNFDFISRLMEFEGMYYYFEHGKDEKDPTKFTIINDKGHTPKETSPKHTLRYISASSLEQSDLDVREFRRVVKKLPKSVTVQDFDYQNITKSGENSKETQIQPISKKETVSDDGFGDVMFFGGNLGAPEDADKDVAKIAKVRAEELKCRKEMFYGKTTAVGLRSGYFMKLSQYPNSDTTEQYLVTEVKHEGTQVVVLASGARNQETKYSCEFTAIPATVKNEPQFRPERLTVKPRITGTMSGMIDGKDDKEFAALDEYGRYKVQLLYNATIELATKGSAYIRMATPNAGLSNGMNFPLRSGAEVLLSFVDGDPDQPVIIGAVPNQDNPSVVNNSNYYYSGFATSSGNQFYFSDNWEKYGYEIYVPGVSLTGSMKTNTDTSKGKRVQGPVKLGTLSDNGKTTGAVKGYTYKEGYDIEVKKGGSAKIAFSMDSEAKVAMANKMAVGMTNEVKLALDTSLKMGSSVSFSHASAYDIKDLYGLSLKKIPGFYAGTKTQAKESDTECKEYFQVTAGESLHDPVSTFQSKANDAVTALVYLAQIANIACLSLSLDKTYKAAEEFGKGDYSESESVKKNTPAVQGLATSEKTKKDIKDNKLTSTDYITMAEYSSLVLSLTTFMYVMVFKYLPRTKTPVSAFSVHGSGIFSGVISADEDSRMVLGKNSIFLAARLASPVPHAFSFNAGGGNCVNDISAPAVLKEGSLEIFNDRIEMYADKITSSALEFSISGTPRDPVLNGGLFVNNALSIGTQTSHLKSAAPSGPILQLGPTLASLNHLGSSLEVSATKVGLMNTSGNGFVAGSAAVDITGAQVKIHGTLIDIGGGAIKCVPGVAMQVGDSSYILAGNVGDFPAAIATNIATVTVYGGLTAKTNAKDLADLAKKKAISPMGRVIYLRDNTLNSIKKIAGMVLGKF